MTIPASLVRQMIQSKGWAPIDETPYSDEPIALPITSLGSPARTALDDVIDHRQGEVELLRRAARLVASADANATLFDRFLTEALDGK